MSLDYIKNRNKELERLYFTCTKEVAVTYDPEYNFEYYTEDYTKWLESKLEEMTKVILRSVG